MGATAIFNENSFPYLGNLISDRFRSLTWEENLSKDGVPFLFVRKKDLKNSSMSYITTFYIICTHSSTSPVNTLIRLMTYHGKMIDSEEIRVTDSRAGGAQSDLLYRLDSQEIFLCSGISLGDYDMLAMVDSLFIEEALGNNGGIVLRSRNCTFAINSGVDSCLECKKAFLEEQPKNDMKQINTTLNEDLISPTSTELMMDPFSDLVGGDKIFGPDFMRYADNLEMQLDEQKIVVDMVTADNQNEIHCENVKKEKLTEEAVTTTTTTIDKTKKLNGPSNNKFQCFCCSKSFTYYSAYNRHIKKCGLENDGDEDGDVVAALNDQTISKTNSNVSKTGSIEGKINNGMGTSDFSGDCQVCLQKFNRKGAYERHLKLHGERMDLNSKVNCPICKLGEIPVTNLNRHIHEFHDHTKGSCGICFELMNKELLSRHFERSHNYNVKKHLCQECGQKFKFPGELKYHITYAHDTNGDKSVICHECGKVLPHRKAYTKHVRGTHNKTKVFECTKCDRKFFENYRLQKHLKIHSGLKPYKCYHCDYRSARRDNVQLHIRKVHKIVPTLTDIITITNLEKVDQDDLVI